MHPILHHTFHQTGYVNILPIAMFPVSTTFGTESVIISQTPISKNRSTDDSFISHRRQRLVKVTFFLFLLLVVVVVLANSVLLDVALYRKKCLPCRGNLYRSSDKIIHERRPGCPSGESMAVHSWLMLHGMVENLKLFLSS